MILFTIKSFIKNLKNHLVYLLFLTFSISAITIFSNLITVQEYYNDDANISNKLMSLIVITMIVFLGFYAFQFYLKNQSKLLSILRLGGSSFYKILIYMLLQLIIIFIVAIALGVNLGFLFYQFISQYISSLLNLPTNTIPINLSLKVFFYIIIITAIELIYLLLLTVGYVYRHQIKQLSIYQEEFDPFKNTGTLHLRERTQKYHKNTIIFGVAIYLFLLIKGEYYSILIVSLLFVVVLYPLCLRDLIFNTIKKIKERSKDTNLFMGLSHLDFSFRKVFQYINFLSILLVFIVYFIVMSHANLHELIYYICVFLTISLVFLISILYQFILSKESRHRDMLQLRKLGKTKKELKKILFIEINGFYGLLLFITFIFPFVNLIISMLNHIINPTIVMLLIGSYIGCIIVLYIMTNIIYHSILKNIE